MHRSVPVLLVCLIVSFPLAAGARNTAHELSIQEALESPLAQEKLLDLPLYFGSQGHPAVAKTVRKGRTSKATRSMFRSDEEACQVAFLSGLIALQKQARSLGATAIIDIRSNTGGPESTSSTTYKCAAGGAVARVNLTGIYVTLR